DDEIAHHGQLAATAERKAADGGDHRLAAAGDIVPAGGKVLDHGLGEAVGLHFLDIRTGGKGLLRTGDDDGADAGICLEGGENAPQLVKQLAVQRVQRLRPV